MTSPLPLNGEAREVVLAEAQAVYAMASDADYRDRLSGLVGAASEGEVGDEDAATLEELIELGLQSGRIRALYGPGGEQAALRLYRRLPRGSEVGSSAAAVTKALAGLAGKRLDSIRVDAVGPGTFALALVVDGTDFSIRLDRQGARLASVGT
jgi:hypothetical protein